MLDSKKESYNTGLDFERNFSLYVVLGFEPYPAPYKTFKTYRNFSIVTTQLREIILGVQVDVNWGCPVVKDFRSFLVSFLRILFLV
jgi:hypothetical protein